MTSANVLLRLPNVSDPDAALVTLARVFARDPAAPTAPAALEVTSPSVLAMVPVKSTTVPVPALVTASRVLAEDP